MKRQQPERYQDIPIPDALGDVIDRAAARAKHQRRRRRSCAPVFVPLPHCAC